MMFSKKSLAIIVIAFALTGLSFDAFPQANRKKHEASKKPRTGKDVPRKIVSFGVLNGKARNLVRPDYPLTAAAVRVKGRVQIQVLINENGEVVEAKAIRGNPLLIPASLRAAKASIFEPIVIGGQNTRIAGIIVYNYLSDSMNWLELGYSSDSLETLNEYLPAGFDSEREFIANSKSADGDQRRRNLETVISLISGHLSDDEKSLWLFSLGKQLKTLETFHWDPSRRSEAFREIDNLLLARPENVSRVLANNLKGLIEEDESDALNGKLLSLTERLYALGK